MVRVIKISLLLLVLPLTVYSLDQDFIEWINEAGVNLSYEPYTKTYIFRSGKDILSVSEGKTYGILNSTLIKPLPELSWKNSEPHLAARTYTALSQIFSLPNQESDGRRRIATIFIDAGHGGKDPGAIGSKGSGKSLQTLKEKDLVLKTALYLRTLLLKAYPDIRIVLSRETDVFLSLDERTKKANALAKSKDHSVLFVSLHANASLNTKASGYEVWYLPPETRRQVVKPGDYAVDESILPIINTLKEEEISVDSYLLASNILEGIKKSVGDLSKSRGLKQEEWHVVRNAFMPSILVELGFVSNPEEFSLFKTDDYLQKLAEGIYSGISTFVGAYQTARKL